MLGSRWIPIRHPGFLSVRAPAKVLRGKFLDELASYSIRRFEIAMRWV